MTSFPGFSTSMTLHPTESAAAAAVTSDNVDLVDWTTTSSVDVASSSVAGRMTTGPGGELSSWSAWTAAEVTASDAPSSSTSADKSVEAGEPGVRSTDDVAYQRLKNLSVIVVVYALVLVAMIVLACRRRHGSGDYGPMVDWTDLEACGGGGGGEDEDDSSSMFRRYWETRRDVAERQRLLDALRVDSISIHRIRQLVPAYTSV